MKVQIERRAVLFPDERGFPQDRAVLADLHILRPDSNAITKPAEPAKANLQSLPTKFKIKVVIPSNIVQLGRLGQENGMSGEEKSNSGIDGWLEVAAKEEDDDYLNLPLLQSVPVREKILVLSKRHPFYDFC